MGEGALAAAEAVYVGSQHIREVLEEVVGHVESVVEVPPGVDIDEFVPQERARGARGAARGGPQRPAQSRATRSERLPDEGNAARLETFFADGCAHGRLLRQADREQGRPARCSRRLTASTRARVIVGFGDYRERARAARRRACASGCSSPGRSSTAISSTCCRSPTPPSCPRSSRRHSGWWQPRPPSAGCPPLVARHTGLAEIAAGLEQGYPAHLSHLAAFATGDVPDLRRKLSELLALSTPDREALRASARRTVEERWSWAGVAARLLAPVA